MSVPNLNLTMPPGARGGGGGGKRTGRFDLQADVRAQGAVPPVDAQQQPAGVEPLQERDVGLGEGRDAAKGVDEGGVVGEVLAKRLLLLLRGVLVQRADDAANLFDCGRVC